MNQPSVLDLIKAGMGKDGRFRAVSSEGSEHVVAEIEIHVDLTDQLVLTIEHGMTLEHWAIDKQPDRDPPPVEIALCLKPIGCTSAVRTATDVWVCRRDFHLDVAKMCNPQDCQHKDIRTLP